MQERINDVLCQLEHREAPKLFYSEADVDTIGHILKPLICKSVMDISSMFGLNCGYNVDDFHTAKVDMSIKAVPKDINIGMICLVYPQPKECPLCLYQFFVWNDVNWFKHVYTYEFCKDKKISVKDLRSMGVSLDGQPEDMMVEVYHIGGWTAAGEHESFGMHPFTNLSEVSKTVGSIYMNQMVELGLISK